MGSDCKVIDWNKPVHTIYSKYRVTILKTFSNRDRLIEWRRSDGILRQAIVDERGHYKWASYERNVFNPYMVTNVPEEKREWLVFYKDDSGNWDYLCCGEQPWTNSFADQMIAKFAKRNERDGGYTDFAKVRYAPIMHGLK